MKQNIVCNDLVSIITPSYNTAKFIEDTIKSVREQTYSNWEMIIIDDESTDNSNKIIEAYINIDKRIKLLKLKKGGPAKARNVGIENASGRYITFIDSDDLWAASKLEKQTSFMINNQCALSYTYYDTIDEHGIHLKRIITSPSNVSYKSLLKSNHIGCLTAMYDTAKVGKMYMPLIDKRQDYGLWLRILKKTNYAYCINEVLASYRIRSNSISKSKTHLIKYHYILFRNHEKLSIIKSVYYVCWNIVSRLLKLYKFQI